MTPEVKDKDGKLVVLVKVNDLKYKHGGKIFVESLPWYSNGKDWFVEKSSVEDYVKFK
jgi:hypothetical protein